ncbi:MAG: bifunctional DNA primase/polymerase [Methanobacteriota archaeon]
MDEVPEIEPIGLPLAGYIDLYRSLGLCVIPAVYGDKRPEIAWETYQSRRPGDEEIARWFHDGRPHNIAIVCGQVSDDLAVLDFDDVEIYKKFFSAEKIERETMVVRTGGGKRHVYLRSSEQVPSFKIPQMRLEVRSDGNIVVAPPSLHPSRNCYQFADPGVRKILRVDDLLEDVTKIVKKFGIEPFQIADHRLADFEVTRPKESFKGKAPPCIHKLLMGAQEGFRNEAAARIASYYLHLKSYTLERAWKRLKEWNERNRPPMDERELRSVLNSIAKRKYIYLCKSMAAFCDRGHCGYIRGWLAKRSVEELLEDEKTGK